MTDVFFINSCSIYFGGGGFSPPFFFKHTFFLLTSGAGTELLLVNKYFYIDVFNINVSFAWVGNLNARRIECVLYLNCKIIKLTVVTFIYS